MQCHELNDRNNRKEVKEMREMKEMRERSEMKGGKSANEWTARAPLPGNGIEGLFKEQVRLDCLGLITTCSALWRAVIGPAAEAMVVAGRWGWACM